MRGLCEHVGVLVRASKPAAAGRITYLLPTRGVRRWARRRVGPSRTDGQL